MRLERLGIFALAVAPILGFASAASAQTVLGSFQGPTDPTDAGWIDVNNGDAITIDPNSSFVAAGVPGDSFKSARVRGRHVCQSQRA